MNINKIIEELKNKDIINHSIVDFKSLDGGTTSQVFVLYEGDLPVYVIKLNDEVTIEAESKFLKFYNHIELLPRLIYVDPFYRYILYTYISGETKYSEGNKQSYLRTLVKEFINLYEPMKHNGFGYMDEPVNSWTNFLMNRVIEGRGTIRDILSEEDHHIVMQVIRKSESLVRNQYLLHGDCGIHNYIFHEEQLHGIIDPTPVVGEPIYDLIYAFCSSPDDLTIETLEPAIDLLLKTMHPKAMNIQEEVILGLYLRISTCIKHHPNDLEKYLTAWTYWKNLNL